MHKFACVLTLMLGVAAAVGAQQSSEPVFKSGVQRMALAAVVRDGKGKLVTGLTDRDFELLDSGRRTPLIGVWSEASPASVAVLLDVSGSMATKLERARDTSRNLMASLQPGIDEAALFSFDTQLTELRAFSSTFNPADDAMARTHAFGATSLWDAIAATANRIASRQRRRALVVITDGVDSASQMKPADVSAIASSLDVPVYIVVISFALDDEAHDQTPVRGPLGDLAAWTGGALLIVRDQVSSLAATHQITSELQHQYVVAFEPASTPGWHELVLRTRKSGLFVRARNGYTVEAINR